MKEVFCPICGLKSKKFSYKNGRNNVLCPHCGSFERHRHQFYVFKLNGLSEKIKYWTVLHIGKEDCESIFLKSAFKYITFDKDKGRANITGDICQLPFGSNSIDLVWASHILEHIENVSDAISEIYRVLRKNGVAMFDVPLYGQKTKKLKCKDRYGHIWHPGMDWFSKYSAFRCEFYNADICPESYGALKGSIVTLCFKRKSKPI